MIPGGSYDRGRGKADRTRKPLRTVPAWCGMSTSVE